MRFLWLSCILCTFHFVCTAAPVFSPPRDVSIPVRGKTGGYQSNPRVVSGQNGFLLLWIHRDRFSTEYLQPSRLLALRVDTNGVPLDNAPILVSESPSLIERAALASDGTNYILAWLDGRGSNYAGLYATMVTSSGVVTVSNGFRLNTSPILDPRLVGGAEGFFLLWRDWLANEIRGARISSTGVVLDPSGVHLDLLPSAEGALASDGSNHVFVASQYDSMSGTSPTFRWRIAQGNASVSSAAKIADANTSADEFSLAFNGSRFLLTARHSVSNAAFFLNSDGTLLGPGPVLANSFPSHQVTSSRGEFLVLRPSTDQLDFFRYSGTGVLLATNTLRLNLSTSASDNSFASGFHVSLLFRRIPNSEELIASVVRRDGSIRNQFSPQGPNQQNQPVVVSDGSGYLAAWTESRDGSNIVYAVRVGADGNPLPPGPLVCGEGSDPHAAYSSGIFLMVWARDDVSIFARRLRQNGSWLDPEPLLLRTNGSLMNGSRPAVAASSTNFLVVWDSYTNLDSFVEQRVNGMIMGTNAPPDTSSIFEISHPNPRIRYAPEITFNGTDYIVAWQAYQPGFFYSFVAWRFVSPAGQLLPASGSTSLDSFSPLLARHGNTAWMLWWNSSDRVAEFSSDGSGQLVPAAGVPVGIAASTFVSLGGKMWIGGTLYNTASTIGFTAFSSPSNLAVAPFAMEEDSQLPYLASNGTNLLCAYRSPSPSFDRPGTPRVRLRAIYSDTTLRLTRAAGLRLTGSAQHPFLIDQSTDLILWQPYRTNTALGSFDYPVPPGTKQFFRLRWYP